MEEKLILVEGLPSAGKTTVSSLVNQYLVEQGIRTEYFEEGAYNHPADFEAVAYFDERGFRKLLAQNKEYKALFKETATKTIDGYLIYYGRENLQGLLPPELYSTVVSNDVYKLPLELHIKLVLKVGRNLLLKLEKKIKRISLSVVLFRIQSQSQ